MADHLIAVSLLSLALLQDPAPAAATGGIEGHVIDATSRAPIAGARVVLGTMRDVPGGVLVSSHPEEAITDARGGFAFSAIPAGHCQIVVESSGYAWPPDGAEVWRFLLAPGETVTGVEITLKKAALVAGRLTDAGGQPVTRTIVNALKFMVRDHAVQIGSARTDDVGEFRFDSLSEGAYLFAATGRSATASPDSTPSSTTAFLTTYYPGTSDRDAAQRVIVRSGETVTGVQFSLLSAPAFQISGIVIDAKRRPVPGALVTLMPANGLSLARMSAQAAADGGFQIAGVVAGRYRLSASARTVQIEDGFGGIILAPIRDGQSTPVEPMDVVVDGADVADVTIVLPTRK